MPYNKKELEQVNKFKAEIAATWAEACKFDGVDPASKFVIFSGNNEAGSRHNDMMGRYFDLVKRINANRARRERHAAMKDLGLTRVKGALGTVYYE